MRGNLKRNHCHPPHDFSIIPSSLCLAIFGLLFGVSYHVKLTSLDFPVAQMVKCLPIMWETWVQSLGQEDFLEKEMATHSSILAWKIPWTEEPGRLQSVGSQRGGHN